MVGVLRLLYAPYQMNAGLDVQYTNINTCGLYVILFHDLSPPCLPTAGQQETGGCAVARVEVDSRPGRCAA